MSEILHQFIANYAKGAREMHKGFRRRRKHIRSLQRRLDGEQRIKPLKWECDARDKSVSVAFTLIGRYEVAKREKWGWGCRVLSVDGVQRQYSDHKTEALAKARAEEYHEGIVRGLLL